MNKEQSSKHIPPYLKKGDKVGLISTARKISLEELKPGIACIEGLKVGNRVFVFV